MKTRAFSLSLLASLCLLLSASAVAGSLYDNGPVNGTVNAWNISSGFEVTDSFTIAKFASFEDIEFWSWVLGRTDSALTVEATVTTKAFGGLTVFDQVLNLTTSNCSFNGAANANVCLETATFKNTPLISGTYWLQLQNGTTVQGKELFWDENSGVGCGGSDGKGGKCPSLAFENTVGTIPSESFTITGVPIVPEPDGLITMFGGGFLALAGVSLRKVFRRPG
jgi:hypothetical protein